MKSEIDDYKKGIRIIRDNLTFIQIELNEMSCYYINKQCGLKKKIIMKCQHAISTMKRFLDCVKKKQDRLEYYNIYSLGINIKDIKFLYYYIKNLHSRYIPKNLKKHYSDIVYNIMSLMYEEKHDYDNYRSELKKPIITITELYGVNIIV